MFSTKNLALALSVSLVPGVSALPVKREVPQEHSHQQFLDIVTKSLQINNPNQIQDAVFGLLGNAAGAAGQGKITDTDCLQQATSDQAFTNSKAAGDVAGMTAALIYRALERNTGKVGQASTLCTSIKAVNPEIAAIQQHQDAASAGAAETNKAIALALAQQIASIGGDPQDALKSGTFAPGDVNDPTAKGNTCDVADDPVGCIFTQNLLQEDASAEEIDVAVAGGAGAANSGADANADDGAAGNVNDAAAGEPSSAADCDATITITAAGITGAATAVPSSAVAPTSPAATASPAVTVKSSAAATASSTATVKSPAAATASSSVSAAAPTGVAGANLQIFTGALGGSPPPAVTAGGRGFVVEGSNDFLDVDAALQRSCDIQHNACANAANSGGGFSVNDCDQQDTQCATAGKA